MNKIINFKKDIFLYFFKAGMMAVRDNRYVVLTKDFEKAYKSVVKKDQNEFEFYK